MDEKKYYLKLGAFFIFAWLFFMPSINAQASVKRLGILDGDGKKSCQVDLDGDGVKEQLKVKINYDEYNCITKASFYVDDQKALVLKPKSDFSIKVDYARMADSNIFIRVYTMGYSDVVGSDYFYRYDKEKKKLVRGTRLLDMDGWCASASVKSVTGSEMKIRYYHQLEQIGMITWTGTYVVKDGKLKLKPAAYNVKNTTSTKHGDPDGYGKLLEKNKYKAIRDMIFYKDTSMKEESFRIDVDDIITLKKVKYTKEGWFFQFEKGGKKGWLGLNGTGGMELFYGIKSRLVG